MPAIDPVALVACALIVAVPTIEAHPRTIAHIIRICIVTISRARSQASIVPTGENQA
jgi:hypothetical protein